ncbi:MAG: hypothetical protein RBS73_07480 [Prolixibacteraceae bacterium]|jgi:hypothetical protein|nr:hypothetical protein [Prolixibacteraceae bacterium]
MLDYMKNRAMATKPTDDMRISKPVTIIFFAFLGASSHSPVKDPHKLSTITIKAINILHPMFVTTVGALCNSFLLAFICP